MRDKLRTVPFEPLKRSLYARVTDITLYSVYNIYTYIYYTNTYITILISTSGNSFGDADLDSRVQFNIERRLGYDYPTAIQKVAIPIIQMGRDVLARAQTGSGKTVT